ncbi:MAG: hypothetical protein M0Q91_13835 [Methanoregula sp.]|jgi:hypothetical protein|nr:hypothetical protein [Methanoregula sp.]
MNNGEARRRIGKVQGNLMRLVAQLESCKLILIGAGAPDLETAYTDTKPGKKVKE